MGHVALLAGADGEGLSKRLGSLSIGQLRDEGMQPAAIASLLARIGTADPVVPQPALGEIIDGFDLSRFGRATAKFDPAELAQINARVIQQLDFATVEVELAAAGVGGGEPFWQAVRDNLGIVAEAADWWSVCTAPVTPVIEAEAQAVTNAAAELLPDGDLPAEIWRDWTSAIATATGVKGRGLFMPLRLALTGRQKGPEIAPLLSFMGRARVIERLRGNTA
jgi:glutamyl-tRNA synthetase